VPLGSVAEARLMHAAEKERGNAEAIANLKRARDARAAGKASVAAMFYKLAARQATGELRSQVDQEVASLANSVQPSRVAHSARRHPPLPHAASRD
jgi:hypothetical protein